MKEIDPVTRDKIINHHIAKLSQSVIANSLRVSQPTISRIIKRFKSGDNILSKKKGNCGRKKAISIRTQQMPADPRATDLKTNC